ncbi:MAG: tetratricopeptide repeat protein [Planctomycetota bacterium]
MIDPGMEEKFSAAHELLTSGDYMGAARGFDEVIRLSPQMEGAWGNRGYARYEMGLDAAALEDFDMVVKLDPDDAFGHAYRAMALRNLGRYAEALEAAARAIELADEEEDVPPARQVRAWLFARSGQFAAACEDLEIYLERDGEECMRPLLDLCLEMRDEGRTTCIDGPEGLLKCAVCQSAACGYSFNTDPNPNWEAEEGRCPYSHCIEIMPHRNGIGPGVCPVFWHDCPGGRKTVSACPVAISEAEGSGGEPGFEDPGDLDGLAPRAWDTE